MIYRVTIGYYDFDFVDAAEAVAFAESAKMHFTDEKKEEIRVEIEFIKIQEVEAE